MIAGSGSLTLDSTTVGKSWYVSDSQGGLVCRSLIGKSRRLRRKDGSHLINDTTQDGFLDSNNKVIQMNEDFLNEELSISEARESRDADDILLLQKPVRNLSQLQTVVSVGPEVLISDAVKLMAEKSVGCLLVTEADSLVGLFTERDLLRKVVATGTDATTTKVSELMTWNPEKLPIDSPLVFALQRMSVGGYRHVPLLDEAGKPVAVVSMRDIVQHIVSLYPNQVLNLPDQPGNWTQRDGA